MIDESDYDGDGLLFISRLNSIVEDAVLNQSPELLQRWHDEYERTGEHGCSVVDDPDAAVVRIYAFGALLAVVHREVFEADAYFEPLVGRVVTYEAGASPYPASPSDLDSNSQRSPDVQPDTNPR